MIPGSGAGGYAARLAILSVLIVGFVPLSSPLMADGIIIPEPVPRLLPRPQPLSVKYHRVEVEIKGSVATTRVDQVFLNEHAIELEGTYIFPLPQSATISRFSMFVDGRKVEGEVKDRDEAGRIYERIVRQLKDPGLLEYIGRHLFQARVFPIPAHGEKRIQIEYQETLPAAANTLRYRYPLNVERFSPKPLEEVTIAVDVESPSPVKGLYSPSHDVAVSLDGHRASCSYEERDVKPERDFLLYVTASGDDVGMSLLTFRRPGEKGFFVLSAAPGRFERKESPIGKDLVFVIDTSGSMKGRKIEQAKDALEHCVESLRREDRFNIVSFSTEVAGLHDGLIEADRDGRERSRQFIEGLRARGGTDINGALLEALEEPPSPGRPKLIIFLTDGEPTTGETGLAEILNNVADANGGGDASRIFVFGLGYDVNTHLLDRLAEDNRGRADYIKPEEPIDEFLGAFISRVSEPVLNALSFNDGSMKASEIYPRRLPDLFQGGRLLLFGRFEGSGGSRIRLGGVAGEEKKVFTLDVNLPGEALENDFIPRLWAGRKIGYLMSEIRLRGESDELKEEIIRLGTTYGLVTPYTSMLILEEPDRLRPNAPEAQALREMAPLGADFASGMKAETGRHSVNISQSIRMMKEMSVDRRSETRSVRTVGDKTFFLDTGTWVDISYRHETTDPVTVLFLSEGYFRLLGKYPELGRFFALGDRVKVVHRGVRYRVDLP